MFFLGEHGDPGRVPRGQAARGPDELTQQGLRAAPQLDRDEALLFRCVDRIPPGIRVGGARRRAQRRGEQNESRLENTLKSFNNYIFTHDYAYQSVGW